MSDHPRLTRYAPYANGTAFMGMLRQNDTHPEMFGPLYDWTHGPYVLAVEADAEIDRLRAEVERLTRERGEWARKWHRIRGELAEIKWPGMKGVIRPKRAYYETHDPPHCPTCECGASEPNTPGPQS